MTVPWAASASTVFAIWTNQHTGHHAERAANLWRQNMKDGIQVQEEHWVSQKDKDFILTGLSEQNKHACMGVITNSSAFPEELRFPPYLLQEAPAHEYDCLYST